MIDHPMSPGDSSAIEVGPWHYGADYLAVYFRGDRKKMGELIPPPFKVSGGEGIAYVCEIVSVSGRDPGMVSRDPDRTIYREAAVGVKCTVGSLTGVFYPIMWVDSEWALLRGLLNGYQKRLADKIALTKLHPLNPGLGQIGIGSELGGYCMKGSERTLALKAKLNRKGNPSDLPRFGSTFGRRLFPRTDVTQGNVSEAVEIQKKNSSSSDVWLGSGKLETILEIGETRVSLGACYRSGFTITGSRVVS